MKLRIEWIETKAPDWKVAALTDEQGQTNQEVHLNRKSKSGEEFPNFDTLAAGQDIEGEPWKNSAGKSYLFPPKKDKPRPQGNRTAGMEKMMDKKAIQIGAAQDNKERGIMTSSTMRMAVDLTVAQISGDPILSKDTAQIKKMIMDWRNWCATRWELTTDNHEPFPSEPVIQVDEGYDSMVEEYPFHERS